VGTAKWLMVVDLDLQPEIEEEWNRWYDEIHQPEIVECPGFERATRYIAPDSDPDGRRRHLTIYELAGPEAMESEILAKRRGLGPFADQARSRVRVYEQHLVLEADDV
jgi:hypothetical protein